MGGVDDIHADHRIVVKEVGRIGLVRDNAADMSRRDDYDVRPLRGYPILGVLLPAQIDLVPGNHRQLA